MIRRTALLAVLAAGSWSCNSSNTGATSIARQSHSGPMVLSSDGAHLFVVHPDADSVSVLDVATRSIEHEILLSAAPPGVAAATQRFDTAVGPRALALDSTGGTLYVTGQRSGRLYAIDTSQAILVGSIAVCSEPIGALVSSDDANVYVACSQDSEIVQVAARPLAVTATVATPREPWSLAWGADGHTLLATHLLGPGVSRLTTAPFALAGTWPVADRGPETDPTEPHGQVRGIYDVAPRPGSSELWVAHIMLGTDTPQPTLVFNSTVFPALSILDDTSGTQLARLSVEANSSSPGDNGAFGDVVSGPRAMAFSDDGKYAFLVDTDSEDLLVVDTTSRTEATIVRPLPGHMPEGVVWGRNEVYVQERNTEDVVAFKVQEPTGSVPTLSIVQDGAPWKTLANDPMPANLRLGQKLFFSANSDDEPVTQDHWVACASCHLEGRSDAVTWLFAQGPRDTPSNAGGTLDTGFLFRTGDRTRVQDYWRTIDVEQGGSFSAGGAQEPLLDAIAAYVNYALPAPVPPSTDETHTIQGAALAALRSRGETVFNTAGCATCHSGPAKTDSGSMNATLDLAGPIVSAPTAGGVLLHDVGTCVTAGPWPDVGPRRSHRRPPPGVRVRHPVAARPRRHRPLPARRQRGHVGGRPAVDAEGRGRARRRARPPERVGPDRSHRVPAKPMSTKSSAMNRRHVTATFALLGALGASGTACGSSHTTSASRDPIDEADASPATTPQVVDAGDDGSAAAEDSASPPPRPSCASRSCHPISRRSTSAWRHTGPPTSRDPWSGGWPGVSRGTPGSARGSGTPR